MARSPITSTPDVGLTDDHGVPISRVRQLLLGAALLVVGVNMRPTIVAVSPMLDLIRSTTRISSGAAGFLTTLPLICFGIFAPLAPRLSRRHGMEATLMGVLVVLVIGTALRLLPGLVALFGGTVLIGTSVAVANVVVTAMIKRDFGHRVGLLSGLHTTMLVGGAALAAGLTGPICEALKLSCSQAISVWGVFAVMAVLVWAPYCMRRDLGETTTTYRDGTAMWTSAMGWAVALFYAFQSLIYYTTTAWIPSFYVAYGYSSSRAGGLLAVCFICAIATSITVPLLAERSARQGYLAVLGGLGCLVAVLGMIIAPTAASALWVALLGLGLGAVLSLGITFMSMRARGHAAAGHLSAMSQCVGYLVAATGPALFGVAKDATGHWNLGLMAVAVLIIPMTVIGVICGRGTYTRSQHNPRFVAIDPEPAGSLSSLEDQLSSHRAAGDIPPASHI